MFRLESYQIICAYFEVYEEKGNGFLEAVYQECLAMEPAEQQIPFEEKPRLRLEYKARALKQAYEPDVLCFGEIILQIKAVKQPTRASPTTQEVRRRRSEAGSCS